MKTPMTPLSIRMYRFLSRVKKPLTAREVGSRLNIYPHAVYRLAKVLQVLGLIAVTESYPKKFQARQTSEALNLFLLAQRNWFLKVFRGRGEKEIDLKRQDKVNLNLSFIQSRDESVRKTTVDLINAKSEVSLIISGAELPAETIKALKEAVDRQVRVRVLVQIKNQKSQEMFANWKKMGIKVKRIPPIEARIMIFDKRIVYLLSFSEKKESENIGIRFDYPPAAVVMQEVFERQWSKNSVYRPWGKKTS